MQRVPASAEGAFIAAMLVTIASGARATMIPAATDLMEGMLLTVAVEVVICLMCVEVVSSDVFTIAETERIQIPHPRGLFC